MKNVNRNNEWVFQLILYCFVDVVYVIYNTIHDW